MYQLIDDLKTVLTEGDYRIRLLCAEPGGKAILQNILKHVARFITEQQFEWEKASPRLNFLFKLAMGDPSSAEYAKHLAMACGEHLPSLTEKEEEELLPKSATFRQWYALGVLEREKKAYRALKLLRKVDNITDGETVEQSQTAESLADETLELMYLPASNGHANIMIVQLMERIGGMPGGGEELKRIESEAPNYRKTQPE